MFILNFHFIQHTLNIRSDPRNMLARDINMRTDSKDIKVPPRYNHFPRSANMAEILNDVNTNVEAKNAVGMILGSTWMTYSKSGPTPRPETYLIL